MAVTVGEPHHLVLDARAVAGAAGADLSGKHRGPVEVGPDQVMDRGACPRDPAEQLLLVDRVGEKREGLRLGVARLLLERVKVDALRRESAGGAGLEPLEAEAGRGERPAHARGRPLPRSAAGGGRLTGVHHRLEEGAGGEYDRRRVILRVAANPHAGDPPGGAAGAVADLPLEKQLIDQFLAQIEVRCLLDEPLDLHLIEPLVGLGPRPVHRRPLGAV